MDKKIPKDCKALKFSKTACKANSCIGVGPQVEPDTPPEYDPSISSIFDKK